MKAGIHKLTNSEYHKTEALGSSDIKKAGRSMAHYKTSKEDKSYPSKAMVFGSAFHTCILEPARISLEVSISTKKNVSLKERDEASNDGKYLITKDEKFLIDAMGESISKSDTATGLLKHENALIEESIFWEHSGVLCKCRPDIRIPDLKIVVDLKSAQDGSPFGFMKACANFGYDISASHYLNGVSSLGEKYNDFIFIVVEKERPFNVAIYRADPIMIEAGNAKIKPLIQDIKHCTDTGVYKGYPDQLIDISLPTWAL